MNNPSTEPVAAPNPTSNDQTAYTDPTGKATDPAQQASAQEQASDDAQDPFAKAQQAFRPFAERVLLLIQNHPVLALGAGLGVLYLVVRRLRQRN